MDRTRRELLARPGLAKDEHRARRTRDFADPFVDGPHGSALPHHLVRLEGDPAREHLRHDRVRGLRFEPRVADTFRTRRTRCTIVQRAFGQRLAVRIDVTAGLAIEEQQDRVPDADAIAVLERSLAHRDAVHERPVRTAKVAEDEPAIDGLDLAVPARDEPIGNAELGRAVASNGEADAIEWKSLTAKWTSEDDKFAAHRKL